MIRSPFGQTTQSNSSSKELEKRLKTHIRLSHEEGGIPQEGCSGCKSMREAIEKAEKREGLRKK